MTETSISKALEKRLRDFILKYPNGYTGGCFFELFTESIMYSPLYSPYERERKKLECLRELVELLRLLEEEMG